MDGFRKLYDIAVVVSNDTDFATAVHMVKRDLHLKVGIVAPNGKAHRELQKASSFVGVVTKECLAQAQFPNVLYDSKGLIYRPQVWYKSHEVLAVSRLANRLFEIFV